MSDPGPADPAALMRDWITLWHSELAARAADRDTRELWEAGLRCWMDRAETAAAWLAGCHEHGAGTAEPDGAAAPLAPSRDELAARMAELERRLAELETRRS